MKKLLKKIFNRIKIILYYFNFIVRYKKYKKRCQENNKREFIIFNTPVHGNIGDHAIIYAEQKMLDKFNIESIEVPTSYSRYIVNYLKKHISEDAVISITGGGFIGSQWMFEEDLVIRVISEFKNNKLIIFPQTLYYKNDENGIKELNKSKEVFGEAKDLTIFVREEKSYKFAKDTYLKAKVELVPDIVLSLDNFEFNNERKDILFCLRSDVEKSLSDESLSKIENVLEKLELNIYRTDTVTKKWISEKQRKNAIISKLEEFSKYKVIITDRLHGMIFATLTNTPCIVFGNYNYKVEGVYEWIKKVDSNIIYEKNIDNLEKDIKILLEAKIKNDSNNKYESAFKSIYKILEEVSG